MSDAKEKAAKIIERIQEDAAKEAEDILAEARKQVEDILREAREKAGELEREIIAKGEKEAELLRQRIIANAKLRAKKSKLDAKEELIRTAFKEAEEELLRISSSKEYGSILRRIIAEGASSVGEDVEVVAREADAELLSDDFLNGLSKELGVNITLSPESIETMGGVVIRSKNGKIEVNNTFETRMLRMQDALRSKVARILFAE
jgi:V/A-type H+-transporting ATPase subunit E